MEIIKHDTHCQIIFNHPLNKAFAKDLYFTAHENMDRGMKNLILDLNMVDAIDSAGMETLLKINDELKSLKGKLIVYGLQSLVEKILYLTKLEKKLIIKKTKLEAEESIG